MKSALVLFVLFLGLGASAQTVRTCEGIFDTPVFSYAELGLTHPEIEAKFTTNRPLGIWRLKALPGKTIQIEGPDGRMLEYEVIDDGKSIYRDLYFDTPDLKLFNQRSLLRRRTRKDMQDGSYEFVKGAHHAKGSSRSLPGLEDSIVARDEVRGTEYKKKKKFDRHADQIFASERQDDAFDFAQKLVAPGDEFQPVLEVLNHRLFLKFKPKTRGAPKFYVSVDKVQFRQSNGAFNERVEVEVEIADDLTKDSNESATHKVKILDALSRQMRRDFLLQAAPESRYETGMVSTSAGRLKHPAP